MSILINHRTRVLCQGITGAAGAFHTRHCLDYGTRVVGGVTPGKGGKTDANDLPIFDTVRQAVAATQATATMIFVPPVAAADAIMEAADAGLKVVVAITEGIPTLDMIKVKAYLRERPRTCLIGPNCPGIIVPGQCKIGIMPGYIHLPAKEAPTGKKVGIISRSGTLTYEAVWQCTARGIGQTTCIGIGGDPIKGVGFTDILDLLNRDMDTDAIVLIGEIGGTGEQLAAEFISQYVTKPVVAFVAGKTAPPGRRMGHAGAIISGAEASAAAKIQALRAAGVTIAETPAEIGDTVVRVLGLPLPAAG